MFSILSFSDSSHLSSLSSYFISSPKLPLHVLRKDYYLTLFFCPSGVLTPSCALVTIWLQECQWSHPSSRQERDVQRAWGTSAPVETAPFEELSQKSHPVTAIRLASLVTLTCKGIIFTWTYSESQCWTNPWYFDLGDDDSKKKKKSPSCIFKYKVFLLNYMLYFK